MTRPVELFLSIAVPLAATQLFVPAVGWAARRLQLMDEPDGNRRVHQVAVPRVGGVGIMGAMTLGLLVLARALDGDRGLDGVMAGTLIMTAIGLVDDVRGVSPKVKVLGQLLATAVAWWMEPQFTRMALGYGTEIELGLLGLPLLMGWVVVVSNGYNLIDGINGLAGSIGIVAGLAAATIALLLGNTPEALVSLTLAAALFGFLRFNFPRARIFLGDSGSLAIGFMLALLTVRGSTTASGGVIVVIPVLALLVPIFETALTVVRRWLRSVSVVTADAHHIHHRLLGMGLAHREATLVLAGAATLFAALGVALGTAGPTLAWVFSLLVIGALLAALLLAVSVLSYHELAIAGEVLATGPARARRVIRDQIAATDLVRRIRAARTLCEVQALLSSHAGEFGFSELALRNVDEEPFVAMPAGRVWRLDYPLELAEGSGRATGRYSLSVLCTAAMGARPFGSERVLHLLAPALECWLRAHPDAQDVVPARAPTFPARMRKRLAGLRTAVAGD